MLTSRERKLCALWRFVLFLVVLFFAVFATVRIENALDAVAVRNGYRPLVTQLAGPAGTLIATWVMIRTARSGL